MDEVSDLYPNFETYNRHFRKRQDEIFKGVSDFASKLDLARRVDEITVCGHSIGEADRKYFLMISNLIPNATWTFTPHGGSGGQDHKNIASLCSDPIFRSRDFRVRSLTDIIGD
ncbi:AbiH family protein [Salipiger sp.]|uniref:AbiH family protein n=1 Tax=Salipiger sp. TaxID=2078585 RepID=UPI003A97E06C